MRKFLAYFSSESSSFHYFPENSSSLTETQVNKCYLLCFPNLLLVEYSEVYYESSNDITMSPK